LPKTFDFLTSGERPSLTTVGSRSGPIEIDGYQGFCARNERHPTNTAGFSLVERAGRAGALMQTGYFDLSWNEKSTDLQALEFLTSPDYRRPKSL